MSSSHWFASASTWRRFSKKKSMGAISALLQLRPDTAVLYKDGREMTIRVEEVTVGDLLVVRPGDHIPIDAVVVEEAPTWMRAC